MLGTLRAGPAKLLAVWGVVHELQRDETSREIRVRTVK
jgi:hypothetical protein